MKIVVPAIPDEGQTVEFDQETPWVSRLLAEEFRDVYPAGTPARGRVSLFKTNQNVSCNGEVRAALTAQCSRCAASFSFPLEVGFTRHLVPQFSLGPREPGKEDEEIELSEEDMDFGSYQNEEIDLGEILAEEIRLAMPMRFLCKEDCKGLCPQCGANLNEGACSCDGTQESSPFAALKNFKVKS